MPAKFSQFTRIACLCLALLTVSACAGDKKKPLEGQRLSVLQLQKDLAPDPLLTGDGVSAPESWINKYWPQSGGYPNHAMGNLSLAPQIKKAWRVSIGDGGSRQLPLIIQPIVADNVIYTVDAKARMSAFDATTGKKLWRVRLTPENEDREAVLGGGMAFAQGRLFVSAGYNEVRALDPKTGSTIWTAKTLAPTRAPPASLDGRVFVMTMDNQLVALSADTGTVLWTHSGVAETTGLLGSASPAADRTVAVAAFSSGEVFALRPENGRVMWMDNLASVRRAGSLSSIADIRGLPVLDRGIAYAVSYGGRMVAIDQRTGVRIWQKEIGGAETPWVAADTVFVLTDDQQLVALTRESGDIAWVTRLPMYEDPDDRKNPIVWTGPVMAGGRLILASSMGHVAEISPQSGKLLEKWKASNNVTIPPLVADNTLFILSEDGELTAYR